MLRALEQRASELATLSELRRGWLAGRLLYVSEVTELVAQAGLRC